MNKNKQQQLEEGYYWAKSLAIGWVILHHKEGIFSFNGNKFRGLPVTFTEIDERKITRENNLIDRIISFELVPANYKAPPFKKELPELKNITIQCGFDLPKEPERNFMDSTH